MKIELSSIIENQFPTYVREEFPLAIEFIKQYYISSNSDKIVQNLAEYLDLDTFFRLNDTAILTSPVSETDDVIFVDSTEGFPDTYGLLKINNEIITYKSKTNNSFVDCVRGFSGIDTIDQNQVVFTETIAESHNTNEIVDNLSILFLKTFFLKIKQKIAPGFENRDFYSEINQSNFLKRINDFYSSKGTRESFRILFAALYGEEVKVILPRDNLFAASDADYRIIKKLIVEALDGNPFELVNSSIYQDTDGFVPEARGTVTYVEKLIRNNKDYYALDLDFGYDRDIDVSGTIKSDFIIHPKTITTNKSPINANFIDVDSTSSFPESGELIVTKTNGENIVVFYTSKTFNQFLGCSGITREIDDVSSVRYNTFAYGYNRNQEIVKLRITGVLSDVNFIDDNYLYKPGENINIETLGYNSDELNLNTWFFNVPLKYKIENIDLKDQSNLIYEVITIDSHIFSNGDSVSFVPPNNQKISGEVVNVFTDKIITIKTVTPLLDVKYDLKKEVTKVNFIDRPELNVYSSNVQNTFIDPEKSSYVLSPSLPSYYNVELNSSTSQFTINGTFTNSTIVIENHHFYTGEAVVFKTNVVNSLIATGVYFIKRIDNDSVKLATSRENIFKDVYLNFTSISLNGTIERFDFTKSDLTSKEITPQNIIRKLNKPLISETPTETKTGAIGIFNSGVEILNYKSTQQIFYGPIEDVIVTSKGSGYDVITPPDITVIDDNGQDAKVYPVVVGNLKKIDLISSGFDYIDEPEIIIKGGNGKNAKAKANLISIDHIEEFNSSSGLNLNTDTIGFSTYHKFRNSELVIYNSNTEQPIGGLTNNEKYYVNIKTPTSITLHKTFTDSVSGINSINLTGIGTGNHIIKAVEKKKIISSISVLNPGENYTNRKNYITGINTANNILNVKKHNFKDGEIVYYTSDNQVSIGLSNFTTYYVKVIDGGNLKLSGISTNIYPDYLYKTNQFIEVTGFSTSPQYLSYPPITVEVKGKIGVATFSNENYNAQIIPAFRGEIDGITIESGGKNYGSPEIIDFNNQPAFKLSGGSGVQLLPIISNGKIKDVIVLSSGNNYTSYPDVIVVGDGFNAVLTPIIEENKIKEIKVISGGFNYTAEKTSVLVLNPGQGAKFEAKIKPWRINLVEKYNSFDYFKEDDGIISNNNRFNDTLEYYNLFPPKELRKATYSKKLINGNIVYESDLQLDSNGREIDSTLHSPILGWAYDGNPIYGPYGYTNRFGSSAIKQLQSGYTEKTNSQLQQENRPDFSLYPLGFFVEDYTYINNSDLDEHNGRYCITPEYPNGVYAYFTTFDNLTVNNFKKPKFPYVVGNTFYSTPIDFNFNPKSNQTDTDLNDLGLIRNTKVYNLTSKNTHYESIVFPSSIKKELINVRTVNQSKIDDVIPVIAGNSYRVNDKILIQNDNNALVSRILGKKITSFNKEVQIIENIELITKNNSIIGYSSIPHLLNNEDEILLSTYNNKNIEEKVNIDNNILTLATNVDFASNTGIVTFVNVYGDLSDDRIQSNDIYTINNEKIKVINIEKANSRLQVIRQIEGSVGIQSHFAGTLLVENSKKIVVNNNYNISAEKINKEIYFNPKESISIGLSQGIGIVSTLFISNPGLGKTILSLPTRYIHLPGHNLKLNDQLGYNVYNNASISISTNGITTSNLTNISSIFVYPFDSDNIGISSSRISFASTGTLINEDNTSLLYFASAGLGTFHSFTTKYTTLKSDLIKKELTLTTETPHDLSINDSVKVEHVSGITTVIKFRYHDELKRILSKESTILSVDTENNILKFSNHSFENGEIVVYTNDGQNIPGLQNNSIYKVIKINNYKIKLYSIIDVNFNPTEISLDGIGNGKIFSVNPPLNLEKNSTVEFDLSDSSLGYTKLSQLFPAFKFAIFYDEELTNLYFNNKKLPEQNFTQIGIIGNPGAKSVLTIDDDTPEKLYYDFIPIIDANIPIEKTNKIIDYDQTNYNSFLINDSKLNSSYFVKKLTNNTFTIPLEPSENTQINLEADIFDYDTTSTTAKGGISKVKVTKNNPNNSVLPEILDVESELGNGALLVSSSNKIGEINSIFLNDIGFEYPSDLTLKPKLNLPKIIKIQPLFTIKSIDVTDNGTNYFITPDLILIDNATNEVNQDVVFDFIPANNTVNIIRNTEKIQGTSPYIIPINNSSGISIDQLFFNDTTKEVVVILDAQFSDINDFPFENGDKVIVENVVVGDTEKGYNSDLYSYSLFEIYNVDPKIGGIGASFTYSMSPFLGPDEILGAYNKNTIKGIVTPEKYFPTFDIKIKRNQFILGENIFNQTEVVGVVEDENFSNNYIKVLTSNDINVGDILVGQSSKVSAIVNEIIEFDGFINVKSSSIVNEGWKKETGFFNTNTQRLHDNDYYQEFSYSLMSEVEFSKWDEVVNNLNHPSGFKKFSDLVVYSETTGISTIAESDIEIVNNIDIDINLNCTNNFNFVKENSFTFNGKLASNEIYFDNFTGLQDYIESNGNRVLKIDETVIDFSSDESIKDSILLEETATEKYYYQKYFVSVLNKWYPEKSSIIQVTLLHNNASSLVNQYSEVISEESLGYFDSQIENNNLQLRFYPYDYEYSSYYINHLSFNVGDNHIGVSTLTLGNIAKIEYSGISTSSGIGTTTVLGISTEVSSAKLLVGIKPNNQNNCEFTEITILNYNNEVYFNDYGNLRTSGIGTYDVYYTNDKICLDFIPNEDFGEYKVNIISNIINNTSTTGVGSTSIGNNYVSSSASSTTSGIATEIFRYSNENSGSYNIIFIKSNTDSMVKEFVSLYNPILDEVTHVDFGNITTNNNLGIITSYVEGTDIVTYFIPSDSAAYTIRTINNIIGTFQTKKIVEINSSFDIATDFNFYEAALFGTQKDFELLHQGLPIFNRTFDGSSIAGVNTENDTIRIPNHFFVTGEEVEYFYEEQPISIASTFVGIGITDKLPKNLFIVKVNDIDVKVATSASFALLPIPKTLDLSNLGIGSVHGFKSKLQNNRSIITVDNMVQNPLGLTTISKSLAKNIGFYESIISVNDVKDIKTNDIIKINDEIIRVISVGVGSTNSIFVDRAKLGTSLQKHEQGDTINKIVCNYNIIDSKLYFDAPSFVSGSEEYNYNYIFNGRVFLRSGILNGNSPTYTDNYIFDDISNQFNGIQKSFNIKENNNDIIDVSQDNVFVTINNIFQTPQTNYSLQENGSATNLNFIGNETESVYDINTATIPRGGIIFSVGSTQGFGYQPLVSAGGTAIVSVAGTIQAISIGNSGSGYRPQIQTVNIGIKTENINSSRIEFIGTATVSNGNVVGVSITNPGIGYTAYPIKYETLTTSEISIGSTVIPIDYISGLTTSSFISVGSAITNANIVGVGSTTITIASSFAPSTTISVGTTALIKEYYPPVVVFDAPLPYANLPLKYVNGQSGMGTEAKVSVVIGQGSSVIDFEITNFGYGYKIGDQLTIDVGGTVGIPINLSDSLIPFSLTVTDIFNDSFSAIRLGELQLFDPIDQFFDGVRKTFQLKISNVPTAIVKRPGSNINLADSILIFINDVLQLPNKAYFFEQGSTITFDEPPQPTDKSLIIFYKGTRDIDTITVDVIEEIEIGDSIKLNSDSIELQQDPRRVFEITSPDSLKTYLYSGGGITEDDTLLRPIDICMLTEDIIIDGNVVSKDRIYYEPIINPSTVLISNISLASTEFFVENVRAFFDNKEEYLFTEPQNKDVRIISTGNPVTYENFESVIYDGDYGYVSGIKTTSIGVGSTGIVFQLFIPQNSVLRTDNYVLDGVSGIKTGYYFKISGSNIGNQIISLNNNESPISIGTTFIDNVYKAYSVSIAQTSVLGVGLTDVVEVTAKVDRYVSGVGISNYYGNFSWARIHSFIRKNPKEFNITPTGFNTAPLVQRIQPIKYENYSS